MSEKEMVNHPDHYQHGPLHALCGKPIEVIDITEAAKYPNLSNVLKYVMRADHKGNAMQDLEKAAWYINREIERRIRYGEAG